MFLFCAVIFDGLPNQMPCEYLRIHYSFYRCPYFDTIHRTCGSVRLRSNFLDEIQINFLITMSCH